MTQNNNHLWIHFTAETKPSGVWRQYLVRVNGKRQLWLTYTEYALLLRLAARTLNGRRSLTTDLYPQNEQLAHKYVYRLRHDLPAWAQFKVTNKHGYMIESDRPLTFTFDPKLDKVFATDWDIQSSLLWVDPKDMRKNLMAR